MIYSLLWALFLSNLQISSIFELPLDFFCISEHFVAILDVDRVQPSPNICLIRELGQVSSSAGEYTGRISTFKWLSPAFAGSAIWTFPNANRSNQR